MTVRGKQKIDPTLREYHMRRIEDARARLWGAKAEFEERKRQEWAQTKARLERDTHETVWAARDANLIIEDIKHAYGVSNSSVIYNVLRLRPTESTPTLDQPLTDYTYTADVDDATLWCVTETETGRAAYGRKSDNRLVRTVGQPSLLLEMRKDPNHEAWAVVPTTTNGDQP